MSLAELLPAARGLSDQEKLVLIRTLADEMAAGSDSPPRLPPLEFLNHTPLEAYGAAYVLQQMLEEEKASK